MAMKLPGLLTQTEREKSATIDGIGLLRNPVTAEKG